MESGVATIRPPRFVFTADLAPNLVSPTILSAMVSPLRP